MIAVALWVLVALAAAILVIVSLPVHLIAHAESEPHLLLTVRASLGNGLVPAFPVYRSDAPSEKKKAKKAKRKRDKATKREDKPGRKLDWMRAIPNLLKDLKKEIAIEHFRAHAIVGLGDPADTGALFGQLAPWRYGLGNWTGCHLELQPDFDQARLAGQLDLTVKVTPIRLLPPLVRFGLDLWRPKGARNDDQLAVRTQA
ncbi:MAG: DUF2953 domain-containing protein [Rhizobiales bacterium]|nr:DUF2953 domain-containing protein [Hyphomicrobiales bacterium]MBO6697700.1 DUF2953 domain-containing protein [Hyphomicrobiales bacterium]MBO6736045.1 DUF2953 domain-containing protein [Hyphomicrobiales bacterium]MBO6912515.1 DUF2953 domain-containing protein [Hyphomicrobiales bacterium]MBO6956356.1 DUF2953 domain-containing protein [Hyphomicrobiales bacterium]